MYDIDFDLMRRSGHILAETLKFLSDNYIQPGISSLDISKKAEEIILSYDGALPAFKGYHGFPEAACVSINNQVVHAIPKADAILSIGDIVSVDCGVIFEGHFTDACRTIGIGDLEYRTKKLVKVTRDALCKGIEAIKVGNRIGDISFNVQKHVERNRFNVSLNYVGHGIGRVLHGPPCVPNYGPPGVGDLIKIGTCLAVEPVVFDGSIETILHEDKWTVLSKEGNLSAHFEDTIIVTDTGPEIVTQ